MTGILHKLYNTLEPHILGHAASLAILTSMHRHLVYLVIASRYSLISQIYNILRSMQ